MCRYQLIGKIYTAFSSYDTYKMRASFVHHMTLDNGCRIWCIIKRKVRIRTPFKFRFAILHYLLVHYSEFFIKSLSMPLRSLVEKTACLR